MNLNELFSEFDFPSIPLPCRKKGPPPKDWQKAKLKSWRPSDLNKHNYGIPTGYPQDGGYLMVLDVDPSNGGDKTLDELQQGYGSLPPTFTVKTGSGGRHFYFISEKPFRSIRYKGLDFQSQGVYVVGPGCIHATGNRYEVVNWCEIADMPEWFEETRRLQDEEKKKRSDDPTKKIPKGERDSFLTSRAGKLRRDGFSQSEIAAALSVINKERLENPKSQQSIERIAKSVSRYDPAFSFADEKEKKRELKKIGKPGKRPLKNYKEMWTTDEKGADKLLKLKMNIEDIWDDCKDVVLSNLFFDEMNQQAFYDLGVAGISRIDSATGFEAFLESHFNCVWDRKPSLGLVSPGVFLRWVQPKLRKYKGISTTLDYPLGHGGFYIPKAIRDEFETAEIVPSGAEGSLEYGIEHYMTNLASEEDRQLMFAAFHSMVDGRVYPRPMMVIDSVEMNGQGTGKTTLAHMAHAVIGSVAEVNIKSERDDIFAQIGLRGAVPKVIFMDNVKQGVLSSDDLEKMITAKQVALRAHRQNYVDVPNKFSFWMTINDPVMSRDLAQRALVIKVKQIEMERALEGGGVEYFTRYRMGILKEIHQRLAKRPLESIEAHPGLRRWATFQKSILGPCGVAREAMSVAVDRQEEADVSISRGEEIGHELLGYASTFVMSDRDANGPYFDPNKYCLWLRLRTAKKELGFHEGRARLEKMDFGDLVSFKRTMFGDMFFIGIGKFARTPISHNTITTKSVDRLKLVK